MMRLNKIFIFLFALLLSMTTVHAKEQLMVRNLKAQRVDAVTAEALSDIIKSILGEYYSVQSMDALAALSSVVEEKLKAGCDDTKCLIEVAGAMDIGLVATGSISKLGSLYTLNMQLISTRGANLGVVQRASEECRCSDEDLVALSRRVALQLIGKTSSLQLAASAQRTSAVAPPVVTTPAASIARYSNLGNGIILDKTTGLMWQQVTKPQKFTWEEAKKYCADLSLGGYSDWYLPTQQQLESLVDLRFNPTINISFFPDTQASDYWSYTHNESIRKACLVDFSDGDSYFSYKSGKAYVRAVRNRL
ncbi:MAG: DUF1566 domain-containing protein [Deltaproteobacteria bacterium]|nr:DUF1566 domain-containing protein [Deltaproteobacteria bacterium]